MNNPFEIAYFQTTETDLEKAIKDLIKNITYKNNCLGLNFFGNSGSETYVSDCERIIRVVSSEFSSIPLVSFIPQPLCDPFTFCVEIISCKSATNFEYKAYQDVRYVIFDTDFGRSILIEGVKADSMTAGYASQSSAVFSKISAIFSLEDFGIRHIVRQWNYIGDITGFENGNQHYQLFNNARSGFYKEVVFENGYPAATGISMSVKGVFVTVLAIIPTADTKVFAIDNQLQIPPYKYSESTLVEGKTDHLRTTPKFERGKLITNGLSGVFFVSGTAAIRNELSANTLDAALQTRQTIENINFLISAENLHQHNIENNVYLSLNSIRVYVKRQEDFISIKAIVEEVWPNVPAIYLLAEVCRPELLVEIEGMAS